MSCAGDIVANDFKCGLCFVHISILQQPIDGTGFSKLPLCWEHKHDLSLPSHVKGKFKGFYRNLVCNNCNQTRIKRAELPVSNPNHHIDQQTAVYLQKYACPRIPNTIDRNDPCLDALFDFVNMRLR